MWSCWILWKALFGTNWFSFSFCLLWLAVFHWLSEFICSVTISCGNSFVNRNFTGVWVCSSMSVHDGIDKSPFLRVIGASLWGQFSVIILLIVLSLDSCFKVWVWGFVLIISWRSFHVINCFELFFLSFGTGGDFIWSLFFKRTFFT